MIHHIPRFLNSVSALRPFPLIVRRNVSQPVLGGRLCGEYNIYIYIYIYIYYNNGRVQSAPSPSGEVFRCVATSRK